MRRRECAGVHGTRQGDEAPSGRHDGVRCDRYRPVLQQPWRWDGMLGSALATLFTLVALHVPPPLRVLPHHPHDIIDCVELSPQYGRDRTLFATSEGTINLVV